jgi:prepilin-type N-terminal cleavage/methylation domain-containing protein
MSHPAPDSHPRPWRPLRRRAALRRPRWRRHGFTLIEAAIATVVIGVGFTAMLNLLAAGTMSNRDATELTTALNLAGNLHEAAVRMKYDDLFDLEKTYPQAVDARLNVLPGMPGWSQVVDVTYVDPSLITKAVPDNQYEPTTRVTVSVRRNNHEVYRTSWIAAASN